MDTHTHPNNAGGHSHGGHGYMDMQSGGGSSHSGMDGHKNHMENLKIKFLVSLILSLPVFIFSPMMGMEFPWQIRFPGSGWAVLFFGTALFFYGGMPFLKGALSEIKNKSPAMMTLISLGITTAYVYSVYAFLSNIFSPGGIHRMDFFWELATLIIIMLLGHWIEMNAVGRAGNALKKMAELLPDTAVVTDSSGKTQKVLLRDLAIGNMVLVKTGERIPADGTVVQGQTTVNESMVTGESGEVKKETGDTVIGGSINGSGTITITVTGTGDSGYLSKVMDLVKNAQQEKSRSETLADKVAKWLFYAALAAGILSLIIWFIVTGDFSIALERMVTVLIIACPHALGLAIPLVIARCVSLGAKHGLLVRSRKALELAVKTDTIMLDKTGTLTEGKFSISRIVPFSGAYDENTILSLAAAVEAKSNHPLSAGIVREAEARGITIEDAKDSVSMAGIGIQGTVNGRNIKIVSPAYMDKEAIPYPAEKAEELAKEGNSISIILEDGKALGLIAQGDRIKEDAKDFIEELKRRKINPVMLSGDNRNAAERVASALGIADVRAGLLPEDKEREVTAYREKGNVVMMVGDGVNDAPALARADVGVAIGAGTDIAVDTADIILVKNNPADILHFLSLSKNTSRKMKQNLWWGAGYNIVAIPLAAGILAPIGIVLSPAVGAILMSLSTVIVAGNAFLLKL
ncbi:copper-translocating P-type ATPase [Breznakiella homolactica]|uniref:Copper-translocating P-type ATPase n=1 Tax=Breznakiella homolactica TaxID=2798577 RepID=A0A7T7XMF9_9SPIR|nr:copper-translocating P-type ATPase [Breznakiella homolactica]QQO09060.1 copper-translocating P-type ATPase [Breznakiella homolactica]